VNTIGGGAAVYVPSFTAKDQDLDARFGLRVFDPHFYIAVAYMFRNTNYEGGGSPGQQHGVGFGIEKLPELKQFVSIYGDAYYFPQATTNNAQLLSSIPTYGSVQYNVLKYQAGITISPKGSPIFLDLGYLGDKGTNKQNAPSDYSHGGIYTGLGVHF
jgi:hypothetical protein